MTKTVLIAVDRRHEAEGQHLKLVESGMAALRRPRPVSGRSFTQTTTANLARLGVDPGRDAGGSSGEPCGDHAYYDERHPALSAALFRDAQASDRLAEWIGANRGKEGLFDHWSRFFANDPVDPKLLAAMEARRTAIVDARDPSDMLKQMARSRGYNPAEYAARFSRLSADELIQLFDDHAANDVTGMMEWADRLADQPGAEGLRKRLDEVLRRIAARSSMREDRLRG